MTSVEEARETASHGQRFDHDIMHFVVDDVASCSKVNRVYDFVKPIYLVPVQILCLPTVTRIVEKQTIIPPCTSYQPLHPSNDIIPRRNHSAIPAIAFSRALGRFIREKKNLGDAITTVLDEEISNVACVIDAPSKSVGLGSIVYADA
jgi:hypothetical protein